MIVSSDAPLALDGDVPAAFATLAVHFHLDPLGHEDAGRLERAGEIVRAWIGAELRWSWLTFADEITPFRPVDFEYMSTYCEDLEVPQAADPESQIVTSNLIKLGREDYGVMLKGGRTKVDASPWSFAFWAEIPEVDEGTVLRPLGVVSLTVPTSVPLADFAARVHELAGVLRFRWATAGLGYSTWNVQDWEASSNALYAHARRFPGFDVGYYHRNLEAFLDRIRTVNWLTYLGPRLTDALRRSGRSLSSSRLVGVAAAGAGGVVLRAGDRPEPGDVNRLSFPRSYVEADAMVRPIRASDPAGIAFLGPWDEAGIAAWLTRFEKRVA
ncbi:type VI immunity family protein [Sorangium sp. So ce281]|uniref:type VI immunity family protein n=1 Tax=Sorangium sp. So ce281 TaxID=3133293 RepID=UPI003F635E2C